MAKKAIRTIHDSRRDDIDDLITRRALPGPTLSIAQLNPFLFLNHHGPQVYPPGNSGLPFGPHPHRGFETVTFILEGELMHEDTSGSRSVIGAGGVQWMTAGKGLIHAELSPERFKREGGPLEILQLWVNLPARLKGVEPRYLGLQGNQLREARFDEGKVSLRAVSGDWGAVSGPIRPHTDVRLALARFARGGSHLLEVSPSRRVFFYVVRGAVQVNGSEARAFQLVEFEREGGTIGISATEDSVLLLGHAEELDEPVQSYGPFVMNTRQEIAQAIEDFNSGRFGAL